ncbi:MAG: helix-turn-helix transcriptional regulator [Clostridia bacterium]|nr:helix-turn-helix transcriptional regulator [Clostridia bacterium]
MAIDYSVIGKRIKKSRIENNLTQEDLAEKLNVSVAFISRIERGSTHINLTRLSEICTLLNVDEGTILNGTSMDSTNYLSNEFTELFKNCPKEKQKLIYNIAQLIINELK